MQPVPVRLVRSVTDVAGGPGWADLALELVSGLHLGPALGVLTGEEPAIQGIVTGLPNLPPLPALPVERTPGTLRVRFAAPDTVRLTLVVGRPWRPTDDGRDLGMLVDDQPGSGALTVVGDAAGVTVTSSDVTCRFGRRPFGLLCRRADGRGVVEGAEDRRQVAGLPLAPVLGTGPDGLHLALALAPDELVTGLGEQFGPVVRNGQRLALRAEDALGAGTGLAYKAAPVFHSTAGYTAFLHTPGPAVADVGAAWPAVLTLQVEGDVLDLFLILHPDPKVRLTRYAELTGRPPRPPRWALGAWMSRCRYQDRGQLEEAAAGLRRREVPCDVLHIDPDWLERDRLNCDFVWSRRKFGDPRELVATMAERGFRVSLWECPYLDSEAPAYSEGAARGFLVKGDDGAPVAVSSFTADGRPRGMVDFSSPAARSWWQAHHRWLLDLGVAVFTTDFGEGLPDGAEMADGRTGRAWRNLYPLWYNRTVAEVVGFVWGRSGWSGSQRYPGQWGGDPPSTVAGMAATVRAGLSWAVSAPGWWGHDIGGFSGGAGPDGRPTPELFVRWAQWGCLSPLARFHGLGAREPWTYGERALGIVREFLRLRYRLLPYLAHVGCEAAAFGWPALRPVWLEHPEDRGCWQAQHQYLLGRDLLVVPVLDDGPDAVAVACYLPPGGWVDWWSGDLHRGPGWVTVEAPLERLPVFVRAGAILPLGPEMQHTGQVGAEAQWTLHGFPGLAGDGAPGGEPGADRITTILDGETAWRCRHVEASGQVVALDLWSDSAGSPPAATRVDGAVVHLPGRREVTVPVRSPAGGVRS